MDISWVWAGWDVRRWRGCTRWPLSDISSSLVWWRTQDIQSHSMIFFLTPYQTASVFFLFFLCLNLTISGHDKRLKTEPKGRWSSRNMHCQHLFRWLQVFSQKKLLWGAAKRQTTVTPPSLTQNNHSTYSILVARVLKALTTHTCESADILHEINLSVAAVVCI